VILRAAGPRPGREPLRDGLKEVKKLDLHNKFGVVFVAPTFSHLPWYADHPTKPRGPPRTYFLKVVVPFIDKTYPCGPRPRGGSFSGSASPGGGRVTLLRHPTGSGASHGTPRLMMDEPGKYGKRRHLRHGGQLRGLPGERAAGGQGRQAPEGKRLILSGTGTSGPSREGPRVAGQVDGRAHEYRDGPARSTTAQRVGQGGGRTCSSQNEGHADADHLSRRPLRPRLRRGDSLLHRCLRFAVVEDTAVAPGKRWVVVRPPGGGTALLWRRPRSPEQAARVGDRPGAGVLFLQTALLAGLPRDEGRVACASRRSRGRRGTATVAVFLDCTAIGGTWWDDARCIDRGVTRAAVVVTWGPHERACAILHPRLEKTYPVIGGGDRHDRFSSRRRVLRRISRSGSYGANSLAGRGEPGLEQVRVPGSGAATVVASFLSSSAAARHRLPEPQWQ